MSENKRYYWLKLNETFFEDDTIEWIEDQPNGERYVLFYLKLCLKSLKNEGNLIRYVGEKLMPYDIKALGKLTNTDQDTVAVALKAFEEIGLIERKDTGEIYMKQINEMIGSETDVAKRVRKHRAKQQMLQSNSDETKGNTEIDIEIEKDKDKEDGDNIFSKIVQAFQNNGFGLIHADTKDILVDLTETYSSEWTLEAIEIAVKSNVRNLNYVEGILKRWKAEGKNTEKHKKADDPYAGVEVY